MDLMYLFLAAVAVGMRCSPVQLLTTTKLLGELRHHAEHDTGEDLVAVEGAIMHPDLDRLRHLAVCAGGDRQIQWIHIDL